MALLGVARTMDIGPWRGWEITNDGEAMTLGPIASPVGQVVVSVDGGVLTLAKGSRRLLVTNIYGAISQLHFDEGLISLVLPPMLGAEGAYLHFPHIKPENIFHALVDGQPATCTPLDAGSALRDLPGGSASMTIALFHRDAPLKNV
jgi:putative isomerase